MQILIDDQSRNLDCRSRSWTLLDMLRFYAASFTRCMVNLENVNTALVGFPEFFDDTLPRLQRALREVLAALEELPVSESLKAQGQRLQKRLDGAERRDWQVLLELSREFGNSVLHEMSSPWFLMIPASKRHYYEQFMAPMGAIVEESCPEANYDISAAARCLALDEWTACVFHLMRVLEIGLHRLADDLGLAETSNISQENWKNVIDRIERKIREMEQLPRSQEKSDLLQFYSQAASNFRYFKDAWRNHVSHSRAIYDERSATSIWNHVSAFMQDLALHETEMT
jgi:hypothetical protein